MGAVTADRGDIGGAARFEARASQDLRRIPILRHCLILVCDGVKELADGDGAPTRIRVGEAVLLNAGGRPNVGNRPDPASGRYLAQVLTFGPRAMAAFRQLYPSLGAPAQVTPRPWRHHGRDAALAASIRHAAAGLADGAVSDRLALHRCVEVLAVLAERGIHLPTDTQLGTVAAIEALVAARPHVPWTAGDAARILGVSEPTLRRRLAAERTSFRTIVADVRLTHGLMLLHTTTWPVVEVALACGYESPSRFASRFRDRFGMAPSEVRCAP